MREVACELPGACLPVLIMLESAAHLAARDRKASRSGRKPAFLQKRAKSTASKNAADLKLAALGTDEQALKTAAAAAAGTTTTPTTTTSSSAQVDPTIPKGRQDQTALIRRFHAIEKQLASPALTDPAERNRLELEREQLGGLETYQAASQHGGDKVSAREREQEFPPDCTEWAPSDDETAPPEGKSLTTPLCPPRSTDSRRRIVEMAREADQGPQDRSRACDGRGAGAEKGGTDRPRGRDQGLAQG